MAHSATTSGSGPKVFFRGNFARLEARVEIHPIEVSDDDSVAKRLNGSRIGLCNRGGEARIIGVSEYHGVFHGGISTLDAKQPGSRYLAPDQIRL
jgi:hypothetical protein